MAGGMDWFRWHHGCVTDPKFQLVAKRSGASLSDVLAVWAYLLESASAASGRGSFGEVDAEALDCLFSFPDGRTAEILAAMEGRGLIEEGRITSWDKRQPKREREEPTSSTERVQQHRAKKQSETPCNANQNQETPRREEKREEEITTKPLKAKTEPRGTRLASDWLADDEHISFCKQERPDLDPMQMQDKFRDYWTGVAGKAGLKLNWLGTWKNFIRSERAPPNRGSPAKPEKFDPTAYVNSNRNRTQPHERTIDLDATGEPV